MRLAPACCRSPTTIAYLIQRRISTAACFLLCPWRRSLRLRRSFLLLISRATATLLLRLSVFLRSFRFLLSSDTRLSWPDLRTFPLRLSLHKRLSTPEAILCRLLVLPCLLSFPDLRSAIAFSLQQRCSEDVLPAVQERHSFCYELFRSTIRRISPGLQRRMRGPQVPVPRETIAVISPTSYTPSNKG